MIYFIEGFILGVILGIVLSIVILFSKKIKNISENPPIPSSDVPEKSPPSNFAIFIDPEKEEKFKKSESLKDILE